jgi:hypothetical protein
LSRKLRKKLSLSRDKVIGDILTKYVLEIRLGIGEILRKSLQKRNSHSRHRLQIVRVYERVEMLPKLQRIGALGEFGWGRCFEHSLSHPAEFGGLKPQEDGENGC